MMRSCLSGDAATVGDTRRRWRAGEEEECEEDDADAADAGECVDLGFALLDDDDADAGRK